MVIDNGNGVIDLLSILYEIDRCVIKIVILSLVRLMMLVIIRLIKTLKISTL